MARWQGHGLFLHVVLTPVGWLPDFGRLIHRAGESVALAVAWFLAALPLAALAVLLRRPLERQRWLAPVAALVAGATLAAFAIYARTIWQGA